MEESRMDLERWRKVDEVFQAAIDCDPSERAAFLDQACKGDSALRGEVEAMIAADQQAGSFIQSPALEIDSDLIADRMHNSIIGRSIGPYKIISLLGSGGMAEVYLASDTRLGRRVALKLLPPSFTQDREKLRRFRQEARAASALNYPNIITIFEIGQVGSIHFIATEYIEGQTFRQRMASPDMTLRHGLDVVIQVGNALAAAHATGIVHRDIKPENVMIRPDGYVKVLDFGLAKLTEADSQASQKSQATLQVDTEPGIVMGTVSYMSPEQAQGLPVDARTDIFSLGVIIYEMVTGHTPFQGETVWEVIAALLNTEPNPLKTFLPDDAALMQQIVSKALAKEREQRYQKIEELVADLEDVKEKQGLGTRRMRSDSVNSRKRANATVSVREETVSIGNNPAQPAGKHAAGRKTEYIISSLERYKRGVFVALSISLLLVAFVAYLFFKDRGHPVGGNRFTDSIAVLPFADAGSDPEIEYLSEGIMESLTNSLSQLPSLRVVPRSTVSRYKGKQIEPYEVGRKLGARVVLKVGVVPRGDALNIQAELVEVSQIAQLWGRQYDCTLGDLQSVQDVIAKEVSKRLQLKDKSESGQHLARRHTAQPEAYRSYLKGLYLSNKFTPEGHRAAGQHFTEAISLDPNYALPYAGLAKVYAEISSHGLPPSKAMPRAKDAVLSALALDESLAEAHHSLALVRWWGDWDFAAAEREFKRAIELNPNRTAAYNDYSNFLVRGGRVEEAVEVAKRALEIDSLSLESNRYLAMVFYYSHKYDRAIEQARLTLDLDPEYDRARFILGLAYVEKGMLTEAITELEKVEKLPPNQKPGALGYANAIAGRTVEAREILADLKERFKRQYTSPYEIARIYVGLDNKEEAFKWLEKAFEERSDRLTRLKVDPTFDKLRSDSRFTDLLHRVGLTP